eukprot:Skav226765  [mRNA]  locus=scaffold8:123179:125670:+ [translate_table: standard]
MTKQRWLRRAISNVTSSSGKARSGSNCTLDPEEFSEDPMNVPSMGGCVELQEHSKHLLPEEVLFEPTEEEIFAEQGPARHGARLIFLNTPLSTKEADQFNVDALVALRKEWMSGTVHSAFRSTNTPAQEAQPHEENEAKSRAPKRSNLS